MDAKLKTIGLVRFSVLTPTFNSEKFSTLESAAASIFAPERMELRFRLFEGLCLPSLVRQSDPNFECVVLTAKSMPAVYLDRLQTLLAPHRNLHCRPVDAAKHYPLIRRAYHSVPVKGYTHRLMFRLDDDDALDIDYIARTKQRALGLLNVQADDAPFVIAYNRGYYARATDGGVDVFDACERAPLSAGTALVAPVDHPGNPYRFNHRKFAQHYNTYSDISVPAFVRTIHGDNHSTPAVMGLSHKQSDDEIDQMLETNFELSTDDLRELLT